VFFRHTAKSRTSQSDSERPTATPKGSGTTRPFSYASAIAQNIQAGDGRYRLRIEHKRLDRHNFSIFEAEAEGVEHRDTLKSYLRSAAWCHEASNPMRRRRNVRS